MKWSRLIFTTIQINGKSIHEDVFSLKVYTCTCTCMYLCSILGVTILNFAYIHVYCTCTCSESIIDGHDIGDSCTILSSQYGDFLKYIIQVH